jgi:hypothetical protein
METQLMSITAENLKKKPDQIWDPQELPLKGYRYPPDSGHRYKGELSDLLNILYVYGWRPTSVKEQYGGLIGKYKELTHEEAFKKALDDILAIDVGVVNLVHEDGTKSWVFIVLGNEPGIAVADYDGQAPESLEYAVRLVNQLWE